MKISFIFSEKSAKFTHLIKKFLLLIKLIGNCVFFMEIQILQEETQENRKDKWSFRAFLQGIFKKPANKIQKTLLKNSQKTNYVGK